MKKKRYREDIIILLIGWIGVFLAFGVFDHIPDHSSNQTKTVEAKIKKVHKNKRSKKQLSSRTKKYMAQCMMAEAGDQGEHGMRLVCDVILNRTKTKGFPDSVVGVINQKNAFEVVSNDTIHDMKPTKQVYKIIEQELYMRYNCEILYFRMNKYHSFGTPCFKYKDHYFSK